MSGRRQPPSCKHCGEPQWRSKHPFGVCPQDQTIPGGPEFMRLLVPGWEDTTVRVVRRTPRQITVAYADGHTVEVQASGVLFPVEKASAA